MEQNLPLIAKKVWSLMRLMFFMLKKGISKTKFLSDLNNMMKRGKIAGKSLQNLLFHHHHNWAAATFRRHPHQHLPSDEYQASCSNTPFSSLSSQHSVTTVSPPTVDDIDEISMNHELFKALEVLTRAAASPGFGKSPRVVKQLRITDSPFPLCNGDHDGEVDEAAEKFIMRFYNGLSRQN